MSAARATAADAARAIAPDELLAYVKGRRWFGAKGAAPTAATIAHALPLPWGDGAFALLRVDIETGAGTRRYQLPLAARPNAPSGAAAIGTAAGLVLYDATEDDAFRRELAGAFARGCVVEFDVGRWVVERKGDTALVLPPDAEITVGSAEQSNTSLRLDKAAILKLFRRIEPGLNPDVEITDYLTIGHAFPHTPVLLGTMWWEDADGTTTGGMLQELVPGATDAWAHALEAGMPYFDAPRGREAANAFAQDAAQLGRVTRAMHDALGAGSDDAAFTPEDAEEEDVQAWGERAEQQVEEAIALLERQVDAAQLKGDRLAEARVVVGRHERYIELVNEIVDSMDEDPGRCIRHHGDYHLGQVLRSAGGEFMIIDFEGEPARPLEERRRKQSALRDVAGMLRSFSYAAATLAARARQRSAGLDGGTLEVRTARWERDARTAFIDAYFGREAADYLPRDAQHARQLLTLFEIEKVFYELAYELNNRPDWVGIPLRGVARLT